MILTAFKAAKTLYDAYSGGVVFTGIYANVAPPSTDGPYIVMTAQSSPENDTFTTDNATVYMAFNLYTEKAAVLGDSAQYMAAMRSIFHRAVQAVTDGGQSYKVSFIRVGGFQMEHETRFIQHVEQYVAQVWAN